MAVREVFGGVEAFGGIGRGLEEGLARLALAGFEVEDVRRRVEEARLAPADLLGRLLRNFDCRDLDRQPSVEAPEAADSSID